MAKRRKQNKDAKAEWRRSRRARWFADKSCVQCGSVDRLELDHIDPNTRITSALWDRSAAFREAELTKCQVLCRKCHRVKTTAYMRELALARTHCIHGHEMTPENTYYRKAGRKREYRTCVVALTRVRWNKWYQKRKQVRAA